MQTSFRRKAPPNISRSKFKPLKKGLWKIYAPGLIFRILRYPRCCKTQPQRSRKKMFFCSPEIPLLPPPVSDGTRTPNEWLVDDHKIHLEDQASKRSDQIWENKQQNTTLEYSYCIYRIGFHSSLCTIIVQGWKEKHATLATQYKDANNSRSSDNCLVNLTFWRAKY